MTDDMVTTARSPIPLMTHHGEPGRYESAIPRGGQTHGKTTNHPDPKSLEALVAPIDQTPFTKNNPAPSLNLLCASGPGRHDQDPKHVKTVPTHTPPPVLFHRTPVSPLIDVIKLVSLKPSDHVTSPPLSRTPCHLAWYLTTPLPKSSLRTGGGSNLHRCSPCSHCVTGTDLRCSGLLLCTSLQTGLQSRCLILPKPQVAASPLPFPPEQLTQVSPP